MRKRSSQILKEIIRNPEKCFSLQYFSEKYGVSERTIYNVFDDIEYFLKENNLGNCVMLVDGNFVITNDDLALKEIMLKASSLNFNQYFLSNEERKNIIIFFLAINSEAITIESLVQILCTSKTSIVNSLNNVKETLENIGISFNYKDKKKGISIIANELQRRDLIFFAYENIDDSIYSFYEKYHCNPCITFLNNYIDFEENWKVSSKTIINTENLFDFELNDNDYNRLVHILNISIFRLKQNNIITKIPFNVDEADSRVLSISKSIIEQLGYSNYLDEIYYLYICLNDYKFLLANNTSEELSNINLHIAVRHFIAKISNCYNVDLTNDYELHHFLTFHLFSIMNNISTVNSDDKTVAYELIEKYIDDYNIVKPHLEILEKVFDYNIKDTDIPYIVLHIRSALIRSKKNRRIPNAILVCASGKSTSVFIKEQLVNSININILEICPAHNYQFVVNKFTNCDVIISNVPLQECSIPVIKVNTILTQNDIANIILELNKLNFDIDVVNNNIKNVSVKNANLSNILKKENIILNLNAKDWRQAIKTGGELLIRDGAVSSKYQEQLIKNIEEFGSYSVFNNGVVMSHANPIYGVNFIDVSLIILSNPIDIGNEITNSKIKYIFTFALTDTKKCVDITLKFMNYANKKDFSEKLDLCRTKNDIIKLLEMYESK